MKRRHLALALAAGLPLAAHATDGYFSHGYGMKAKGMGGAATAVAGSAFGAAANPAVMGFAGDRAEIGVDMLTAWREAQRGGSPPGAGLDGLSESRSNYFFIPEMAFNRMLSPTLSWGVTVYGNGGMKTDYAGDELPGEGACAQFNPGPARYNMLCGDGRLGVDLSQLIVAPSVAWQVAPGHALGVAPLFAYQRFRALGLHAFRAFSAHPDDMTNRGYDDSTGWGARFGYYGRVAPGIAVGASYTTRMRMSEFDKYRGLFAEAGGFDLPAHWSVGAAFDLSPALMATIEYLRIDYSRVKSVGNASATLLACIAGNASACLGGANGAGFGWRDVNAWKVGVERRMSERLTLRGGYNYSDNPIRGADVTFNILAPGVIRHHVTAGATWRLDAHSEATGALMWAFANDVRAPGFFNNFGLQAQERIEMYEWSLGVQYARRF